MEHKDTEQKYDLYTEKIVLSPKVKYKNLIRTIKILILIIIAGVVYIAADKLIVPSVKAKFDKKKAEQDRIEFTRDEYPEPVVVEDEEGQPRVSSYDREKQRLEKFRAYIADHCGGQLTRANQDNVAKYCDRSLATIWEWWRTIEKHV